MNTFARIICLGVFGCMTVLIAGCASKGLQSGGDTERTSRDRASYATERINPDVTVDNADLSRAARHLKEVQAEQTATAAAGLRDVFFGYDSWRISEEGRQILTRDAEWLRAHGSAYLKVEGHCDERGSSTYNFVLAEKRAKAVRSYLLDLGVRGERVTVVSYGKERPFCHGNSEPCYQQNRRGHLVIKP